jgi:hypothetical protein
LPVDLGQPAMAHFAKAGQHLRLAKGFLDAGADALTDRKTGAMGSTIVDRRTGERWCPASCGVTVLSCNSIKHSRASLPGFLPYRRASGSEVEACVWSGAALAVKVASAVTAGPGGAPEPTFARKTTAHPVSAAHRHPISHLKGSQRTI